MQRVGQFCSAALGLGGVAAFQSVGDFRQSCRVISGKLAGRVDHMAIPGPVRQAMRIGEVKLDLAQSSVERRSIYAWIGLARGNLLRGFAELSKSAARRVQIQRNAV